MATLLQTQNSTNLLITSTLSGRDRGPLTSNFGPVEREHLTVDARERVVDARRLRDAREPGCPRETDHALAEMQAERDLRQRAVAVADRDEAAKARAMIALRASPMPVASTMEA